MPQAEAAADPVTSELVGEADVDCRAGTDCAGRTPTVRSPER